VAEELAALYPILSAETPLQIGGQPTRTAWSPVNTRKIGCVTPQLLSMPQTDADTVKPTTVGTPAPNRQTRDPRRERAHPE
jgi:hypothetical protein